MSAKRTPRFKPCKKQNATESPNYARWSHARHRCHNEDDKEYFRYGAKGVCMHKDWIYDFSAYEKYIMSLPNALK